MEKFNEGYWEQDVSCSHLILFTFWNIIICIQIKLGRFWIEIWNSGERNGLNRFHIQNTWALHFLVVLPITKLVVLHSVLGHMRNSLINIKCILSREKLTEMKIKTLLMYGGSAQGKWSQCFGNWHAYCSVSQLLLFIYGDSALTQGKWGQNFGYWHTYFAVSFIV